MKLRTVAYPEALRDAIAQELRRDEQVVIIGPGLANPPPVFGDVAGLLDEFGPLRVRDTTGSTSSLIQLGIRAAKIGDIPLVRYPDALSLAADLHALIEHSSHLQELLGGRLQAPMLIKATIGTRTGRVARQTASVLEEICAGVPNIHVVSASDATTGSGLIRSALRGDQIAILFDHQSFYSRTEAVLSEGEHLWPLHSPRLLRLGRDMHLVGHGPSVSAAMAAAEMLGRDEEAEVGVVDLISLNPLPLRKLERWAADSERVLILEHGTFRGGIGSELGFALVQRHPHWVVKRLSLPSGPDAPGASQQNFNSGLSNWIRAAGSEMLAAFPAATERDEGRSITTARRRRPTFQAVAG